MKNHRAAALRSLGLLLPIPTLGVLLAMWVPATRGTAFGQGFYFFSKLWILALPLIWLKWVEKGDFGWSPPRKGGLGFGLALGLLMAVVILGFFFLFGQSMVDADFLRAQAQQNGIATPGKYLFLAAYLTLVNALLEEFVWRWFVFRQTERLTGPTAAMVLSAAFFTVHHIFALKAQFSWTVTLAASAGVFVAGLCWSLCYARYRSVWPGYLSHLLADAAIFIAGWVLLF